ncbi:FHA domain-containing protein [Demequina sediminicola]|uniref:FHA domain-containing protein n=1 Tax=Demequina sediminicola TaxID=1095026 RepID=UPI0007826EBD|nr:FHA domain-containing protein [Demequina sediminicola]
MRITDPHGTDWELRPGTTVGDIATAWNQPMLWCGSTRLSPDHRAGMAPVVEGASLTTTPGDLTHTPSGPYVYVDRGPDAGAMASLATPITVGASTDADLSMDDPTMSHVHARIDSGQRVRVTDLRSTNGIGTRLASKKWWAPGEHLVLGLSHLRLGGLEVPDPDSAQGFSMPWPSLIGGVVSGAMIAVLTGRWYLALVGVAFPLIMITTQVVRRRRHRPAPHQPLPSGPLAVRGEEPWTSGYLRAIMIDRQTRLAQWDEQWTRWLPHEAPRDSIAVVSPGVEAPSWCTTVVDVSATSTTEHSPSGTTEGPPMHVSATRADAAARRIAAMHSGDDDLPACVRWADLTDLGIASRQGHGQRSMMATVGVAAGGPLTLDLDHHGPHLLVAGTTGAGKSVFLETLVTALATAHGPADLALAIMDFKGGAGLGPCLELPHVAATVTDLDPEQARRALAGLAYEVTVRKQALAAAGMASIAQWEETGGAPARLVVVIDEYQEISLRMRDFIPELARIAAQGRSLGLHLVLATQRPSGAVTPEVRANIGSTIALRVASENESRDLLGTADAALIPRTSPGRAILSGPDGPVSFQTASPDAVPSPPMYPADSPPPSGAPLAATAAQRWRAHTSATPLWCPPLPDTFTPTPSDHIIVGVADDPDVRAQHTIAWDPAAGPFIALGPSRSGRTSVLNSISAQSRRAGLTSVWLPTSPREAARTIARASSRPDVLLLIDDADRALATLQTVDDGAASEALMARTSLGLPTAMAASPSLPARIGTRAATTVLYDGIDTHQGALWGVPRESPTSSERRGRGWIKTTHGMWRGQSAYSPERTHSALVTPLPTTVTSPTWGIGGDDAQPVAAPTHATVVGPDTPWRAAVVASLDGTATTTEVATLAPAGKPIILAHPRARDVRTLTRADPLGHVDHSEVPGRVVVITHGTAQAVQLSSLVGQVPHGVNHHSGQREKAHHDRR